MNNPKNSRSILPMLSKLSNLPSINQIVNWMLIKNTYLLWPNILKYTMRFLTVADMDMQMQKLSKYLP